MSKEHTYTNGEVTIRPEHAGLLSLLDAQGRQVMALRCASGARQMTIEAGTLAPGPYYIWLGRTIIRMSVLP